METLIRIFLMQQQMRRYQMKRSLVSAFTALTGIVALASAADNQDWASGLMDSNKPAVTIKFSSGKPDKAVNQKVLPAIISNLPANSNVTINPMPHPKGGSVLTVKAVGADVADMGIAQSDVVKAAESDPTTAGKIEIVGKPVFPAAVRLIVRADRDAGSLNDMIDRRNGKALLIADGGNGSGGKVTATNIKKCDAKYDNAITLTDDGGETATRRLRDGQIDGYIIVDSINKADEVDGILKATDEKGKQLFKVVDVDLPNSFYQADQDAINSTQNNVAGYAKYYKGEIPVSGWWFPHPTKTVFVNYVTIANRAFENSPGGEDAVNAVAAAEDNGKAVIRAETGAPNNWNPPKFDR
jgi:TRAP-type uncharacterized transport system substrate-binding protein